MWVGCILLHDPNYVLVIRWYPTRVPAEVVIKERHNISYLAFLKIQFSTFSCTNDNDKLIMFSWSDDIQ
jgi:hypothetical protein